MNAKRYASALWALFGLFVLRVVAQLSIALGDGSFLPPWEEWFSGALSYPWLLASQIAIIVFYGKAAADISHGRGLFAVPRRGLGSFLTASGSVYLTVMVIRYVIRMAQYPPEVEIFLPGGVVIQGREKAGDLFRTLVKPFKEGGLCGIRIEAEHVLAVGQTLTVQWRATGELLAEPYRGADAFVTQNGLMWAQVTTFQRDQMKLK